MTVNHSKVHDHIQDALDNHTYGTLIQRLDAAFTEVNAKRGTQCENLNLTAADHYLFSRWLVNKYSPLIAGVYIDMIVVYDGIYKAANEAAKKVGIGNIVFKTGNCQPSSFSPMVLAWAMTGVSDAVMDCATLTVFESSPKIYAPNVPAGYFHRLFR